MRTINLNAYKSPSVPSYFSNSRGYGCYSPSVRACFYSKANVRLQKFVSCAIVPRDARLGTLTVNHASSSRLSDIDRLSGRGNVSPISISTRTPRDTRECARTAPADRKTGSLRIMKNWVTQSDGLLVSTSLHENRP